MKHFQHHLDIATFIHVAQSGKEQTTYTDYRYISHAEKYMENTKYLPSQNCVIAVGFVMLHMFTLV